VRQCVGVKLQGLHNTAQAPLSQICVGFRGVLDPVEQLTNPNISADLKTEFEGVCIRGPWTMCNRCIIKPEAENLVLLSLQTLKQAEAWKQQTAWLSMKYSISLQYVTVCVTVKAPKFDIVFNENNFFLHFL
jgi:hypothetical protein